MVCLGAGRCSESRAHQFFAGAAFALQQNRRVAVVNDAGEQCQQIANGFAVADDLLKTITAFHLPAQTLIIFRQAATFCA